MKSYRKEKWAIKLSWTFSVQLRDLMANNFVTYRNKLYAVEEWRRKLNVLPT